VVEAIRAPRPNESLLKANGEDVGAVQKKQRGAGPTSAKNISTSKD
jgi:hypothetical protein